METAQFQIQQHRACLEFCVGKMVLLMKTDKVEHISLPNSAEVPSDSTPKPEQDNKEADDIIVYMVKPTDTLTGIALAHNMRPEKVKKVNQLHSDTVIPGQVKKTGKVCINHFFKNQSI